MTTITSPHNPRLKELRKLRSKRERARSGLFAVEGEDLVLAAQAAGLEPVESFHVSGSPLSAAQTLVSAPSLDARSHEVEPALLRSVSTLGSGARVIAVYEQRWGAAIGPLCVYLHGVGDPGNVGTTIRGALAFGASCVALGPDCADPHSPKAVRASMGALFRVPLAQVSDVDELPNERVALVAGGGEPLWNVCDTLAHGGHARRRPRAHAAPPNKHLDALTLLIGAERDGLPDEVVEACEHIAHIPIAGDSLNAAMAATVALYEIAGRSTRVPS
jgi:RNA methyltransferase, TrmH family